MQKVISSAKPYQSAAVNTSDSSETLRELGVSLSESFTGDAPLLDIAGEGGRDDQYAKYAIISVEDNPIRVALGTAASTTVGHLFNQGDSFKLEQNELELAEFISASTGNVATLQVTLEY